MALGRGIATGCCVAALALAALGCGSQENVNDPRPAPPTRVSVAISPDAITVQPARIGFGPERDKLIQQNRNHPQPPTDSDRPLDVVFVTANLTDTDSKLEIRGPKETTSSLLVANGNGTYQTTLPAGAYAITAADIPAAKRALLEIGDFRGSSQNDVLLP